MTDYTPDDEASSDDARAVISGLDGFIATVVTPLETKNSELLGNPRLTYDENGRYSAEVLDLMRRVREASAQAGYYTMFSPRSVGGAELGPTAYYRVWEHLYYHYGPARKLPYQAIGHWTSGPSFLCDSLSDRLRATVVADLMSGRATTCFAMSEPDAGSDAWRISTRATKVDSGWRITGTKQWISNSPHARYAWVFAVTDGERFARQSGGLTCFLVPTDSPGFTVDSIIKLYGHIGGNESILSMTDVFVPDENVVGTIGAGFPMALSGVALGRLYNAGRCVGLARWALDRSVEYSQVRETFGRRIADHQAVAFMLADSAMDIHAASAMALACAQRLEHRPAKELAVEVAMVKAFCTEMCFRVFDRSIQIHGGMGLVNESKLYDGWHQARTLRIADGTSEVLRTTVAAGLLRPRGTEFLAR